MIETIKVNNNQPIRTIAFQGLKIGGEDEFLASHPVFVLELNIFDFSASSHIVKDWYKEAKRQRGKAK